MVIFILAVALPIMLTEVRTELCNRRIVQDESKILAVLMIIRVVHVFLLILFLLCCIPCYCFSDTCFLKRRMVHSAGVESGTLNALEKHKWTYSEPQDIKMFAMMIRLKYERDTVKQKVPSLLGSPLN